MCKVYLLEKRQPQQNGEYDMICTDGICVVKMYIKYGPLSRKLNEVIQIDGVQICVFQYYHNVFLLITVWILFDI